MEECTVILTKNEVAVLMQLIHIAVQSRGMEVAEAAVVVSTKLKKATEMVSGNDVNPTN